MVARLLIFVQEGSFADVLATRLEAADVYRPCLLALTGSPMHVWPGRGLPSPSRKGAGVWLPR
jgi:hypothetical protein